MGVLITVTRNTRLVLGCNRKRRVPEMIVRRRVRRHAVDERLNANIVICPVDIEGTSVIFRASFLRAGQAKSARRTRSIRRADSTLFERIPFVN